LLLRILRLLLEWKAECHERFGFANCERLREEKGSNQLEQPPVASFRAPPHSVISSAARNLSSGGADFSVAVSCFVRALVLRNERGSAFLAAVAFFKRVQELGDAAITEKELRRMSGA
jgi:hypothetical protein